MGEFDAENEIDDFGSLLTQGVKAIAGFDTGVTNEQKTKREVYEQLGNLIGKAPSTIEYYCRGNILDSPKQVEVLAREIVTKGRLDRRWLIKFLRSAAHHDPGPLCDELFPPSGRPAHLVNTWPDTGGPPLTADPDHEPTSLAGAGTAVPDSPGSDDDSILASYFTDAISIRNAFAQVVGATVPAKRLFLIHGVGGVGKSSLLRMFRLYCKGIDVPVALVSAGEAKSAVDVLAAWAHDLSAVGVKLPAYTQLLGRYRDVQTSVYEQSRRVGSAGAQVLAAYPATTRLQAAPSAAHGFLPSAVALSQSGAELMTSWLGDFLVKADVDLWIDPVLELTNAFVADLHQAVANRRLVLLLDTYEQMTAYEEWLRSLVQRLPVSVLVVIAGRIIPNWGRAWPEWIAYAEMHELEVMKEPITHSLIERYYRAVHGVATADAHVEAIARFARGLPMVVTSAIDLCVRHSYNADEFDEHSTQHADFETVRPHVVSDLVDRLIEGVPPDLLPVIEVAAALRSFNREILRLILGADVNRAYDELRRFSFVRPCAQGLALHDSVREMMDAYLRLHDPQRHHEIMVDPFVKTCYCIM